MSRKWFLFLLLVSLLISGAGEMTRAAQAAQNTTAPGASGLALPLQTPQPALLPSGQGSLLGTPPATGPVGNAPRDTAVQQSAMPQPLYMPGPAAGIKNQLGTPAWQQQTYVPRPDRFPPFGANLFQGRFGGAYHEGLNPNYIIMPGDRILVQIWGARTFNEVLMVDPQGNIFLPEVGPVVVAGVSQHNLQSTVKSHLASVFLSNVDVYASLLSAQPVGVYVTGFVPNPGRYAGGTSDSVLYYLDKAGGIIPERGSYRDITIRRYNRVLAKTDLYPFLLSGNMPVVQAQDGDVIVVGPKKGSVTAFGLIPQHAGYESSGAVMKGAELIRFASPRSSVSHASVTGTRQSRPFHLYLTLDKLAAFTLAADDAVEFLADMPGDAVLVSATGSVLGASRYPVKRSTTLRQMLAYVPVDEHLANLDGIYIKRRSVVEQQRKAILDSLYRLENSVLTASSATAETAAIRVQEAGLVQNFVQRAAKLEPDGVVVVTRNGYVADILLEEGDEVVIPQRSDVLQITGEVMLPKSVVYDKGMSLSDYVAAAGGFTDRADKGHVLLVHPNGEIEKASGRNIRPGDLLMVMPYYDSKSFQMVKDIMGVLYQIAIATKVVMDL
jgi:protein involved in polysaccharide export with SLBB domain